MRGTDVGEEPFPRGRKRAAPFTVRKFSLMLDRREKERERGELASQAYNKIRPQVYQSNLSLSAGPVLKISSTQYNTPA